MGYPTNGYMEINDGTALMRGHMLGATGTFSGKWTSDAVDVASQLQIGAGSVTAWVAATPELVSPGGLFQSQVRATLPAFPGETVIVTIRGALHGVADVDELSLAVYRNGVLVSNATHPDWWGQFLTLINAPGQPKLIEMDIIPFYWTEAVVLNAPTEYKVIPRFAWGGAPPYDADRHYWGFEPWADNGYYALLNGTGTPRANVLFGYRKV